MFLFIGFWITEDPKEPHIILPWSPLSEVVNGITDVGLMSVVNQWMLKQLALAAIALDTKTYELFREKYPRRCGQYVVQGKIEKLHAFGEMILIVYRILQQKAERRDLPFPS